jgi:hypothetical protein
MPTTPALTAALSPATAAPTWSAYEVTPGGRKTLLASGLRYTEVLAARFPEAAWAIVWKLDRDDA